MKYSHNLMNFSRLRILRVFKGILQWRNCYRAKEDYYYCHQESNLEDPFLEPPATLLNVWLVPGLWGFGCVLCRVRGNIELHFRLQQHT